jgi:hypothetical protein
VPVALGDDFSDERLVHVGPVSGATGGYALHDQQDCTLYMGPVAEPPLRRAATDFAGDGMASAPKRARSGS